MPATQTTQQQPRAPAEPPASHAVLRGPFRTAYGLLTTCPVHWWSGPNVAVTDDDAAAVCWETGHIIDAADALRAAR